MAPKISGAEEVLGAEALEINNWILRFGCASEELRIEVAGISDFLGK